MTEMSALDDPQATAWANAADAFHRSGNAAQEATSRARLGARFSAMGQTEHAAAQFALVADLYAQLGEIGEEAAARRRAGAGLLLLQRIEEGVGHLRRAAELFRVMGRDADWIPLESALLEHLVENGRTPDVLAEAMRIVDLVEGAADADSRNLALQARYQLARVLLTKGQAEEAIPHAERAADLAAELGEPAVEAQVRVGAALALTHKRRYEDALRHFDRLLPAVDDDPGLAGSVRNLLPAWDASPQVEAHCRKGRAECLDRLRPRDLDAAREYEGAGRLFDAAGDVAGAGDAYHRAGRALATLAMLESEHREHALALECLAADRFGAVGNWWGKGVAGFGAAGVLIVTKEFGASDDSRVQPLLRLAAHSYFRAGRKDEEATCWVAIATQVGRSGDDEQLARAVRRAVRRYEEARASQPIPYHRQQSHESIMWGFGLTISRVLRMDAARKEWTRWPDLVWWLEQLSKGRSFQELGHQNQIWRLMVSHEPALLDAVKAVERFDHQFHQAEQEIDAMVRRDVVAERVFAQRDAARGGLEAAQKTLRLRVEHAIRRLPQLPDLVSVPPARIESLSACLKPGEAYLGFLWEGSEAARIRVLPDGGYDVATIDMDGQGPMWQWVDEIKARPVVASDPWAGDASTRNARMTEALLGELPGGVESLLVSPYGSLVGLPWDELPDGESGRPLGDRLAIGVVPSAGSLVQLRESAAIPTEARYLGVACNGDGRIPLVDVEVLNIARTYFIDDESSTCLTSSDVHRFFERSTAVDLLHLACHADRGGLLLSLGGEWSTPVDFLRLGVRARLLLLTGCNAGDFATHDHNEFLGIVRQLLVVTGARAAVLSRQPVPDGAGVVFSDVLASALTGRNPGRPWQTPATALPVGKAVAWTKWTVRDMLHEEAELIHPNPSANPADPSWWAPWFVIGDPAAGMAGVA